MAEENLVRRKCDYCGETQEFSQKQITTGEAERVAGWIILVRVFLVNGQTYPVQKHACKDSCASNVITLGMLKLPKEIQDMLDEQREAGRKRVRENAEAPAFAGAEAKQPADA